MNRMPSNRDGPPNFVLPLLYGIYLLCCIALYLERPSVMPLLLVLTLVISIAHFRFHT